MAFTKINQRTAAPASPDLLFRELTRRKYPDVLPHQQAMMRRYATEAEKLSDVALQLPTGSGKTLVGLLIAEWRRKKFEEKVVYLCPTKQLVNQVVSQAEDKYGLSVVGFTGSSRNYSTGDTTKYSQRDCVAITTYSSLFNTNPYFSDADVIIVDDAHAAENYVAKLWTLNISRHGHDVLHNILSQLFKEHIDSVSYTRLTGQWGGEFDSSWVDKLPTAVLLEIHEQVCEIIDTHSVDTELSYAWSMLRSHLIACHIYFSSTEIVIRPLIAPTWEHSAFNDATQRIYMSATLGEGGDLERLLGRQKVHRLPVPEGWDSQGVGRRFFLFPTLSLDYEQVIQLRRSLIKKASRSLFLVPSESKRVEIVEDIESNISFDSYSAEDIEQSKEQFVQSDNSVAVIANRYDGIDFPGEECRLLQIEGLPKAVNAQERFLMNRMGAAILFNERLQTRVLQAIGRCTRSLEDYSAVVVMGDELPDYLADLRRRKHFHPELQAELWFGVEQSKDKAATEFEENFDLFIANGAEWQQANQTIVDHRISCIKEPFPGIQQLERAVVFEVQYQKAIWHGDYVEALAKAESVLTAIEGGSQLRGYRALWEYLAGSAASIAATQVNEKFSLKAKTHYARAKKAALGIPWLIQLSLSDVGEIDAAKTNYNAQAMLQAENIESNLSLLGTTHDRAYSERERAVLDGLNQPDNFENAHKLLGEHLGFDAGKVESEASPDPWWQIGHLCLVFEDHANANPESSLDATKARQVSSHPGWMKANVPSCESPDVEILPVLITPVSKMNRGARVHLSNVSFWELNAFRKWAHNSMSIIRELRKSFIDAGDIVWRAHAIETLEANNLDMVSLFKELKTRSAQDLLKEK